MALKKVTRVGGEAVCTCGQAFAVPWAEMVVTLNDVVFPPCPGCGSRMTHVAIPMTDRMLSEHDSIIRRYVLNQNLHSRAVVAGAKFGKPSEAQTIREREYDLLIDEDEIEAALPPIVLERRKRYLKQLETLGSEESAAMAVREEVQLADKQQRADARAAIRERLQARMRGEAEEQAAQEAAAVVQRSADRQARQAADAARAKAVQERMVRLQAEHAARVQDVQAQGATDEAEGPQLGVADTGPLSAVTVPDLPEPTAENTYAAEPAEVKPDVVTKRRKGK